MKSVSKVSPPERSAKNENLAAWLPTNWTTNYGFECYGVRIGIRLNVEFAINDLQSLLPPFSKEIQINDAEHLFSLVLNESESVLSVNELEKLRFPGTAWTTDALRAELKSCVTQNSPERVFIHAGVVAWENNLIVLPGDGFAGKTTLTSEFVKAGAMYYSDDMAIVDRDGLVYPYPKPLSMREKNSVNGSQIERDVSYFKGFQASEPLPVKLVVITEYQARARWRPQILSPGQGVLEILKHTTNSLRQPQFAVQVLQKIVIQAKMIKSKRGAAEKAVHAILRQLT